MATHLLIEQRGNAVADGLDGQDASGLAIGAWRQTQPPCLADDVAGLARKGAALYYLEEDAMVRGIRPGAMIADVGLMARSALPGLFARYDQVWHW